MASAVAGDRQTDCVIAIFLVAELACPILPPKMDSTNLALVRLWSGQADADEVPHLGSSGHRQMLSRSE
jgi:hypothetical protein